jgi:hypothetical protein
LLILAHEAVSSILNDQGLTDADEPESQARLAGFLQGLQELA